MKEFNPQFLKAFREAAPMYVPDHHVTYVKNVHDFSDLYDFSDISFEEAPTPQISEQMQAVWDERVTERFPKGVSRDGPLLGVRNLDPENPTHYKVYPSSFLGWQCTLPWDDGKDHRLVEEEMRTPLTLYQIVLTQDNHFLYMVRSKRREAAKAKVHSTHNWGFDPDKDYCIDNLLPELTTNPNALYTQCIAANYRELNPREVRPSDEEDVITAEVVRPSQIHPIAPLCYTLNVTPSDVSTHICALSVIEQDAGKFLEERSKYPAVGRVASYASLPFTEDSMRDFFNELGENIAHNGQPALLVACGAEFGTDFFKDIPFDVQLRR